MYKFILPPDQRGYSVKPSSFCENINLDGGVSRKKLKFIDTPYIVTCQWQANKKSFEYFTSFFDTIVNNGLNQFLIDLILNSSTPVETIARFIPDSVRISYQEGHTYFINAMLEVQPVYNSEEKDLATLAYYGSDVNILNASEITESMNLLSQLVNVDLDVW